MEISPKRETRNPRSRSLGALIVRFNKRTPLTIKMVMVTVIVGVAVWALLDQIQTKNLKNIFQAQLTEKLSKQAMEDRLHFDQYIKVHHQLVRLIVTQRTFSDYIEKERKEWSTVPKDQDQIKYHRRFPEWFPKPSVLRLFTTPHCALLLDSKGRVREVYQARGHVMLPSLLQPSSLLIAKSRGQSFLTNIDDVPYVVASESYLSSKHELLATLMVASPIDEEFLIAAMGSSPPGHVVALMTLGIEPYILTSSNPVELPVDTQLDALQEHYLVTGEEFFDYGASDLSIRVASFISIAEVELLTKSVLLSERRQRAISAPVFILTFALIMFWVTRRIQQLTEHVRDFSQKSLGTLGAQQQKPEKGDQLYILEERFHHLTEGVLKAREELKREAKERLVLERKSMEMAQREKQLRLLQSVTGVLGVGVVKKTSYGLEAVNDQMEHFAQRCGKGLSVFEIQDSDSSERSIEYINGNKRVFHITTPDVLKEEKIFLVQDITELRAKTEALEYLALHDVLTGLPNRRLLQDRLQQAIFAEQREHKPLAMLMMDLDRFKEINDTLGHHIGDMLLKQVGSRLQSVLRKSDTVARLGGDEFAVLLQPIDARQAEQKASKLLEVLENPFLIEGKSLYISASIGIVFSPEHGDDVNILMKRADVAMYISKQNQRGVTIYNPDHDSYTHFIFEGELRNAIEQDKLILHYQPKLSFKTSSIIGVEALVRWHHPIRGLIPPDEFIPLAERTGLIRLLTRWVLKTALSQCAHWHHAGMEIDMSVNLSARNLQDSQLPEQVVEQLEACGIVPDRLELEITENAMMLDPARAMEILIQLDAIGVRLSIDDFGTGYSSLAYIKKLPVDEVKIDKSFIKNMIVDNSDAIIVRSTIDLAHNLGLRVVAEGIESQEILDRLEKLGCDAAQGYYISPPLPAEEFTRWLSESKWKISEKR